MLDETALKLWGKTDLGRNARIENYHPLLFHLFDVANCAAELWEKLPYKLKLRMANALKMDVKEAGELFVLLSGLHDIGKANPKFQMKADQFLEALKNAGFDFPEDIYEHPHNYVSVPEAGRLFANAGFLSAPLSKEISLILSYCLGAHHGVFPKSDDLNLITGKKLGVNPTWQEARNLMADALKSMVPNVENACPPEDLAFVSDKSFAPLLAAFISLADWFGSSKHFLMDGAQDVEMYLATSVNSAKKAFTLSGWTAPPVSPELADFATLFSYLNKSGEVKKIEPNPLQLKVGEMLKNVDAPSLWMIEEEMGAGKTETAFSIFDDCLVKGLAHGVYIAMPTQATSNAMHDRFGEFLRVRMPAEKINLILAHSHATLDADYLKRMEIAEAFNAGVFDNEDKPDEGALIVRSWFTHSKQTLLAHYGVGTIDQALMGVLQNRHWFVRLFGLSGKVVVFDEVHAYDAYMNTLLSRLIEWLAELDCTVVLLSATLPKKTRLELANAYAKEAKTALEKPDNTVPYPRITLVQKGEPASSLAVSIVKDPKPTPKSVKLSHLPNTFKSVKTALLASIEGDGCAIIICNTVANAQKMYGALKEEFEPTGWECLLFHARTPFKWRKEKEETALKRFGKESGENRTKPRGKCLLVATQVVEQSLDLDADFMASELAPADLILQRMGRLHRHKRERNTTEPRFALLYDMDSETGLPDFGMSKSIYACHTLLRSWLALKDKTAISLPDDIEPLVTEVYDAPDPDGLPEEWAKQLEEAKIDLAKKTKEQREHARSVAVEIQGEDADFRDWIRAMSPDLLDDDNPETHKNLRALTRDGDPSITVVLCGTDEFGKELAMDPKGFIGAEATQQMMGFSLPLSNKSVYTILAAECPPTNWKKNTHLKHCRKIDFVNGVATVAKANLTKLKLTLNYDMGLTIENEGDE